MIFSTTLSLGILWHTWYNYTFELCTCFGGKTQHPQILAMKTAESQLRRSNKNMLPYLVDNLKAKIAGKTRLDPIAEASIMFLVLRNLHGLYISHQYA